MHSISWSPLMIALEAISISNSLFPSTKTKSGLVSNPLIAFFIAKRDA